MEYLEFKKNILSELLEYYGEDAAITVEEMLKNNSERKEALLIRFPGETEKITPVIYMDSIYEKYKEGGGDIQACVGDIVELREKEKGRKIEMLDVLLEWEKARNNVFPLLISKANNQELLNKVPHSEFLDLAIIYEIRKAAGERVLSCKLTNEMLRIYKITEEELHKQALKNMESDGYMVRDLLEEICNSELADAAETLCEKDKMYILTNASKRHGAAGLLYTDFLKNKMAGMSAYIIPSSIHEVILLPANPDMEISRINSVIEEVNQEMVSDEERLENHCYFWDSTDESIKIPA